MTHHSDKQFIKNSMNAEGVKIYIRAHNWVLLTVTQWLEIKSPVFSPPKCMTMLHLKASKIRKIKN